MKKVLLFAKTGKPDELHFVTYLGKEETPDITDRSIGDVVFHVAEIAKNTEDKPFNDLVLILGGHIYDYDKNAQMFKPWFA